MELFKVWPFHLLLQKSFKNKRRPALVIILCAVLFSLSLHSCSCQVLVPKFSLFPTFCTESIMGQSDEQQTNGVENGVHNGEQNGVQNGGSNGVTNGHAAEEIYDQIVIGAGIIGLWVANELAKADQRVLVLDQFPRCHSRGGSSGSSRAMELAFPNVDGIPLTMECMRMYEELQKETGVDLIKKTKLIVMTEDQPYESTPLPELQKALREVYGVCLDHLNGEQLAKQFPGMGFTNKDNALFDNVTAKEILANKALYALWTVLQAKGVAAAESAPVESVEAVPDPHSGDQSTILEVVCKNRRTPYRGKSVILATGAWTPKVKLINKDGQQVKAPEVKAHLLAQIYFKAKPGMTCPDSGFIEWTWEDELVPMKGWGRPAYNTHTDFDYMAGIGEFIEVTDASDLESSREFELLLEKAKSYVKRRFPCLDADNPKYIERSMDYLAVSQEKAGRHLDGFDNVYLAVEGTSFGMAPVYAKLLVRQILKGTVIIPEEKTKFSSKFHW